MIADRLQVAVSASAAGGIREGRFAAYGIYVRRPASPEFTSCREAITYLLFAAKAAEDDDLGKFRSEIGEFGRAQALCRTDSLSVDSGKDR